MNPTHATEPLFLSHLKKGEDGTRFLKNMKGCIRKNIHKPKMTINCIKKLDDFSKVEASVHERHSDAKKYFQEMRSREVPECIKYEAIITKIKEVLKEGIFYPICSAHPCQEFRSFENFIGAIEEIGFDQSKEEDCHYENSEKTLKIKIDRTNFDDKKRGAYVKSHSAFGIDNRIDEFKKKYPVLFSSAAMFAFKRIVGVCPQYQPGKKQFFIDLDNGDKKVKIEKNTLPDFFISLFAAIFVDEFVTCDTSQAKLLLFLFQKELKEEEGFDYPGATQRCYKIIKK